MRRRLLERGPIFAVLIATGLAPCWWLSSGDPIKGVDGFFSLHPQGHAVPSLYAWDARTSTGQPWADVVTFGLNGLSSILDRLGLSLAAGQAVVLTTLSLAAVFGMYVLLRVLAVEAPTVRADIASAFGAIVWVVNPFSLLFVYWHQLLIEVTWAVLPWVLALIVMRVKGRISASRMVLFMGLLTTIGSAGFPHPYLPGIGIVCAVVGIAAAGTVVNRRAALMRVAGCLVAFVASLLWWLVPSLHQVAALNQAAQVQASSSSQFEYASMFSHLGSVVSLVAVPQAHVTNGTTPYISWGSLINSFPGAELKYVLPFLTLIGLTAWRKSERWLTFMLGLGLLVGVFFVKGGAPPLAAINRAMLNLPLGDVFRHPVDKFSFLLIPLLIIFAVRGVEAVSRERLGPPAAAVLMIIVVGYIGSPWWTGGVIPAGGPSIPSAHVVIPGDYETTGAWLGRQPVGGKTQVEPYSIDGQSAFRWTKGIQPNLDPLLEDWAPQRSLIARDSGLAASDVVGSTLDSAVADQNAQAFAYARLVGVDSWLVHDDWREDILPTPTSPQAAVQLLDAPAAKDFGVTPALSGTNLVTWRQPSMPDVYAATSVRVDTPRSISARLNDAVQVSGQPAPVVVAGSVGPLDQDARAVVEHVTPTRLTGRLTVAGSTVLVFNQTYDADWSLSVDGGRVSTHQLANTFGNAWTVSGNGTLAFTLSYSPQRAYQAGFWLLGAECLAGLAALGVATFRRIGQRQSAGSG